MSAIKITNDNLGEIISGGKTLLLDFFAEWCGPCRMVGPVIDEIAEENPDITVGKVNVDEERELASRYGVFSIPTLVVLKDGEIANKSVGAKPKEQILAMLK